MSEPATNPFTAKAKKHAINNGASDIQMAAPGEAVVVTLDRKHKYVKKPIAKGNKRPSPGCAICNLKMYHYDHVGAPPSLNALGDGDRHKYRDIKESYEEALTLALEASPLPKPLAGVMVQCQMGFPDLSKRDEGNFRFIPEKALGDVLQTLGYISDDSFYPDRPQYRFLEIEPVYDKGNSWVKFLIMPT
jgi:hypothetical protein